MRVVSLVCGLWFTVCLAGGARAHKPVPIAKARSGHVYQLELGQTTLRGKLPSDTSVLRISFHDTAEFAVFMVSKVRGVPHRSGLTKHRLDPGQYRLRAADGSVKTINVHAFQ